MESNPYPSAIHAMGWSQISERSRAIPRCSITAPLTLVLVLPASLAGQATGAEGKRTSSR